MCISKDSPEIPYPDLVKAAKALQVGEIYTVVECLEKYIELQEFPHPLQILWRIECFAPLSEIDETEMERNFYQQNVKA